MNRDFAFFRGCLWAVGLTLALIGAVVVILALIQRFL